jgi:hypothetical protein
MNLQNFIFSAVQILRTREHWEGSTLSWKGPMCFSVRQDFIVVKKIIRYFMTDDLFIK